MQEGRDGLRSPTVVATTIPFFARAATIVDETWRDVDRVARALDQRAGQFGVDSQERADLEALTSGLRELARRLEQTEVALSAYLAMDVRVASVGWDARRALPDLGADTCGHEIADP